MVIYRPARVWHHLPLATLDVNYDGVPEVPSPLPC